MENRGEQPLGGLKRPGKCEGSSSGVAPGGQCHQLEL